MVGSVVRPVLLLKRQQDGLHGVRCLRQAFDNSVAEAQLAVFRIVAGRPPPIRRGMLRYRFLSFLRFAFLPGTDRVRGGRKASMMLLAHGWFRFWARRRPRGARGSYPFYRDWPAQPDKK
jgi:hypothetical protein